uniref:Thioredoxin domain-containing protein n=1 Tax=Corethron hystrix TaxID=216773 RepID=A0A7S1B830_9STRA|mmetsp:Transcript_15447/g.34679  ORF Transcript_15447/g.34679 Transcript_15447/m.34679 type:complete len:325 (+) Transcript_15447:57-1031(+)
MSVCVSSLLRFITVAIFYIELASCNVDKYVKYLDPEALAEIKASSSVPVAIKVDPLGCERAPGLCRPLNEFWEAAASVFPKRIFRLSCAEQQDICDNVGLSPIKTPKGREPMFVFWVDGEFVFYDESYNPYDIFEYIIDEVLPRSAREGGRNIAVAYDAIESYTSRTSTLRKAENLLNRKNFLKAFPILNEYIEKYPDHMNPLLATINAAVALDKYDYALQLVERARKREPNNAFLMARMGTVHHHFQRCDKALPFFEMAMQVDQDSQEGVDKENWEKFMEVKEFCDVQLKLANRSNGGVVSNEDEANVLIDELGNALEDSDLD